MQGSMRAGALTAQIGPFLAQGYEGSLIDVALSHEAHIGFGQGGICSCGSIQFLGIVPVHSEGSATREGQHDTCLDQ
jgi:hypothetical protein